jgi:capsular exopolysaccharide synthesis family protein
MSRVYDALRKLEQRGEELAPLPAENFFTPSEKPKGLLAVPTERARVKPESRIVVFTDPRSPGADRFRLTRMALRGFSTAGEQLKTLLITSPLPQDGKSTIALNLATSLAEAGRVSVLLLEADLHRSSICERLGLQPWAGLTEVLESDSDPMSAVRRIDPLGFYLLPAGRSPENPAELLQSEKFAALLQDLRASFDWILLDSPPIAPLADTVALKAQVDSTLLVARAGSTPRESIEEAVKLIGQTHVIGIVLNAADGLDRLYAHSYYRDSQRAPKS